MHEHDDNTMTEPRAFISHNFRDKDAAREIGLYLIADDIGVWFDEWEISAGDSIVGQINTGLEGCTHFLILWSANSAKSNWVRRELESALYQAITTQTPRVIPVLLDDSPKPALLADISHIRYRGGDEEDRRTSVRAVKGADPSQNLIRAVVAKYHEVIRRDPDDPNFNPRDPFALLAACPGCGGTDFKKGSFNRNDDNYYVIECRECGWKDWTQ